MKTMIKIIPFMVTRHTIKYGVWALDAFDGISISSTVLRQDSFIINLTRMLYKDVEEGRVFIVDDADGCFSCEDPSAFLIKDEYCNWYLSENKEIPLGADYSAFEYVWIVEND